MPMANDMTKLINKIERRLGTKALNLPDYLQKNTWPEEVINNVKYFIYLFQIKVIKYC